jgi:hypothetical protein
VIHSQSFLLRTWTYFHFPTSIRIVSIYNKKIHKKFQYFKNFKIWCTREGKSAEPTKPYCFLFHLPDILNPFNAIKKYRLETPFPSAWDISMSKLIETSTDSFKNYKLIVVCLKHIWDTSTSLYGRNSVRSTRSSVQWIWLSYAENRTEYLPNDDVLIYTTIWWWHNSNLF